MTRGAVLVVDDDAETRDAISDLLEDAGMRAVTATDGVDALRVLRTRPDIELIVLDLMMPVMDGAEFRVEQLKDRALANIPFVLLTGRADYAHMASALGAIACLRKPFAPEALLGVIRSRRL